MDVIAAFVAEIERKAEQIPFRERISPADQAWRSYSRLAPGNYQTADDLPEDGLTDQVYKRFKQDKEKHNRCMHPCSST